MFTRHENFIHTGSIGDNTIKHGAHILNATVGTDYGIKTVHLNFQARLYSDDIWRVNVYADFLPSVQFSGVGDPMEELIAFRQKFIEYFATPVDKRTLPW